MKVEPIQTTETQEKKEIELDIEALIKLGVVERDVEVGGMIFTLRTLTEEEKLEVEQEVNDGLPIDDPKHIMNSKIPTLARAIVKINGKTISEKNRNQLRQILLKMQNVVIDSLFLKYAELIKDQMDLLLTGVKKNGQ